MLLQSAAIYAFMNNTSEVLAHALIKLTVATFEIEGNRRKCRLMKGRTEKHLRLQHRRSSKSFIHNPGPLPALGRHADLSLMLDKSFMF